MSATPESPSAAPPTSPPEGKVPFEEEPKDEQAAKPAVPEVTEFDEITPEFTAGGSFVLGEDVIQLPGKKSPGVECKCKVVRVRQLLAVGRVMTGSTRPVNLYALLEPFFTAETDDQQGAAAVAAFANLVITVPHSEQEFIALMNDLIEPVDELPTDHNGRNFVQEFWNYMDNPDAHDTVKVFRQAYENEAPRMVDLGKALMALFPRLRTGETTPSSATSSEIPGSSSST